MSKEDPSPGNWDFTPEDMKTFSEAKLYHVMRLNAAGAFDAWARAELARRQNESISREVAILSSSSQRLETATNRLIFLTWVLIGVTVFAVVVPFVVEAWKAYRL
jgi:hypothetical protein